MQSRCTLGVDTFSELVFFKLLINDDIKSIKNSTVNQLVVEEPVEPTKINLIIENK